MVTGIVGGIDPGLKGAIVWTFGGEILHVVKLSKKLLEQDPLALIERIQDAPCDEPVRWNVERQQKMKGRRGTAKSLQTMLMNYGTLLTLLRIATPDSKIREFSPSAWKKKLDVTSDKNTSLALAAEKFPGFDFQGNDNVAEAALLATLG